MKTEGDSPARAETPEGRGAAAETWRAPRERSERARSRWLAATSGLSVGLAIACAWLWFAGGRGIVLADFSGEADEVRRVAVEQLVETSAIYDSHPDGDVGRLMIPSLDEREAESVLYRSNRFGLREREYELPKPPGVTRVVLLGDSFVMGVGVEEEDRCGAHLERFLRERAGAASGRIECLQIGIASWNAISECQYLRRQLSLLRPDLVVQVLVGNDQDDSDGVRGYGMCATFSPQKRERADSVLMRRYPIVLGFAARNWLANALDHESRLRYADTRAAIHELRRDLNRIGASYLLMLNYGELLPAARNGLDEVVPERERTYLGTAFRSQRRNRLSKTDAHWSAFANEQVAYQLYWLIVERELLPDLELAPWQEAEQIGRRQHAEARREYESPIPLDDWLDEKPIAATLRFAELDEAAACQVHGGIDRDGLLSPYASMILDARALNGAGGLLRVEGRVPDRAELASGRLRIFVDEQLVTEVPLDPGAAIDVREPLPTEILDRDFVSVRFVSTDYAYVGEDLRRCRSARLTEVALESRAERR